MKKIIFTLCILFSFLFISNVNASEVDGTIYIGDSRTYGMQIYGITNSSNTVYGVGYGYNWFTGSGSFSSSYTNSTSGGIAGANSKMQRDKTYNIVIWLGVNDYSYIGAETYYKKFVSLANNEWKNHNIYIVSVGPVDDDKAIYVSNSGINKFNKNMSNLINNGNINNLNYIDLGYNENSIKNYDSEGLHYGKSDYQKIFNDINEGIERIENKDSQSDNEPDAEENDGSTGGSNQSSSSTTFDTNPLTCNDFFSQELRDMVSTAYMALKILAIVLTILLGSIDFAKGIVSDNQDIIKKASKTFIKRLVALVIIFLLPYIINPIVEMALGVQYGTCNII